MKYGVGPPEEVESRRVEYRGMIEPLQEQGDFLLWAEEPVAVLQEMLFNLEEPVVVTPLLHNLLMTPYRHFTSGSSGYCCEYSCAENPLWGDHEHRCAQHRDTSALTRRFRRRLTSSRGRICSHRCWWNMPRQEDAMITCRMNRIQTVNYSESSSHDETFETGEVQLMNTEDQPDEDDGRA